MRCALTNHGVRGLAVKPPAQARLKESNRSYEPHLHQEADGPALNHLGLGGENEDGREERGGFPS